MRSILMAALLLACFCVSAQVSSQLPCEDILLVNRNGFDGIISTNNMVSSDCVLPEDVDGRSKLTATLFNIGNPLLSESSTLFDQLSDLEACVSFKWEVIGGEFIHDDDGDLSGLSGQNELCATFFAPSYIGLTGSCNDVCTSGANFEANIESFGSRATSSVWIKWDDELNDPTKSYGVKVSLIVKSKNKGKIKFKEGSFLNFNEYEISFTRTSTRTICEAFIPLGVNTNNASQVSVSESDCANDGTRTVDITMDGQITRWLPSYFNPSFSTTPWYRLVVQRRIGGWGYETVATFDSPIQTSISVDVPGLSYDRSHKIRVLEYYGPMLADQHEFSFAPIQGNPYIVGLSDIYMGPGGPSILDGIYGVSGDVSGVTWVIDPPDFAQYFLTGPGGVLILQNAPIGGLVELQAIGTSDLCGNEVVIHKQICIHNRPTGPNNDPCSSFSDGQGNLVASNPEAQNMGLKDVATSRSINEKKLGNWEQPKPIPSFLKLVEVYPNPISTSNSLSLRLSNTAQSKGEGLNVQLLSLTGGVVQRFDHLQTGIILEIDVTNLFPGLFILQVTNDNGEILQTEKIVVVE